MLPVAVKEPKRVKENYEPTNTPSNPAQQSSEMAEQQQRVRIQDGWSNATSHDQPQPSSSSTKHPLNFPNQKQHPTIRDQVHGQIELSPLCFRVIDTPEFQRLRELKQLGVAYYVFPGASHNRFEHSLGVAHLAGSLVEHFKDVQPELGITDADVLCVQLAGLVHDLGHGPFSHMFDGEFIPIIRPELATAGPAYSHERMTIDIFDLLLRKNKINLANYGLDPERDLFFIKECVLGKDLPGGVGARVGRNISKSFLYDIVSNVHSGLDVDKIDYFMRDSLTTGVESTCQFGRLLGESRVEFVRTPTNNMNINNSNRNPSDTTTASIKQESIPHIAFPEKLVSDVLAAFQTRYRLHNTVYQHKVVKSIEYMVIDALLIAEHAGVFKFPVTDERTGEVVRYVSLAHVIDHPAAFVLATDNVLMQIRRSNQPEAELARALLRRIDTRDLYQSVGEVPVRKLGHKRSAINEQSIGQSGNNTNSISSGMHAPIGIDESIDEDEGNGVNSNDISSRKAAMARRKSASAYARKRLRLTTNDDSHSTSHDDDCLFPWTPRGGNDGSQGGDGFDGVDTFGDNSSTPRQTASTFLNYSNGKSNRQKGRWLQDLYALSPERIRDELIATPPGQGLEHAAVNATTNLHGVGDGALTKSDVRVERMKVNHGYGSKNPVSRVYFFSKGRRGRGGARLLPDECYDLLFPRAFEKQALRVFVTTKDSHVFAQVHAAFTSLVGLCEDGQDIFMASQVCDDDTDGASVTREANTDVEMMDTRSNSSPQYSHTIDTTIQPSYKSFQDQIHGHIQLHPLCVRVMDTSTFQRLRHLKQLGLVYHVFPGASHNRFEHCIGVSHLAGKLVRHWKKRQPELQINAKDILCVELAGLIHDLGHGPFSHLFDGQFIPRVRPLRAHGPHQFSHERMSVSLFEYLLKDNLIDVGAYGLDSTDIEFIKECVLGEQLEGGVAARQGRNLRKSFLYDVVSNVLTGLDVDKLDYFERDTKNTGVETACRFERLLVESRVEFVRRRRTTSSTGSTSTSTSSSSSNEGRKRSFSGGRNMGINEQQMCPRVVFPDSAIADVLGAFQTRYQLHNMVYQHKVVKAIELMLVDALVEADKAGLFAFPIENGKRTVRLCDTVDHPEAFALTTDAIVHEIRMSTCKKGAAARALIRRVDTRDLYESVGEVRVPPLEALTMVSPRPGLVDDGGKHAKRPLLNLYARRSSSDDDVHKNTSRQQQQQQHQQQQQQQHPKVIQVATPTGLNMRNGCGGGSNQTKVNLADFATPMSEMMMNMSSPPVMGNGKTNGLSANTFEKDEMTTSTSTSSPASLDSTPDHIHQQLTQDTLPPPHPEQSSSSSAHACKSSTPTPAPVSTSMTSDLSGWGGNAKKNDGVKSVRELYDKNEEEIRDLILSTPTGRADIGVNVVKPLSAHDLIVEKVRVNHGQGSENPVDNVFFVSKSGNGRARQLDEETYSDLCPVTFERRALRVFALSREPALVRQVHDAFVELVTQFQYAQRPFWHSESTASPVAE